MARENRSDRGAMLALASLLVVFSLAVIGAVPAGADFFDTDGDQLPDFYEIKHGIHGTVWDEGSDWDGDGLDDYEEDANQNGIVDVGETDPYNPDTDGDGLDDGEDGLYDIEVIDGGDEDTLINALDWDSDGDFIADGDEDANHNGVFDEGETNWKHRDTDGDGLIDGWEDMWGTDPLLRNTDNPDELEAPFGDQWWDNYEISVGTDPTNPDTDGDGRFDGVGNEDDEDADGDGMNNALDRDSDNDGLYDGEEDGNENGVFEPGPTDETDPENYDTDADGFSDGYENYEAFTDPLDGGVDTDGDGLVDGMEIAVYKTDPNNPDTDGDGIEDGIENPPGTPAPGVDTDGDKLIDPLDRDSDNDGLDDEFEDVDGDGEVDETETSRTLVDTDGDGLNDNAELEIYGTEPWNPDDPADAPEDDGLTPGSEIFTWNTNFDMSDTDGDGWNEGSGVDDDRVDQNLDGSYGVPYGDSSNNALDRDQDGDGLWDADERDTYGTDTAMWDTDGDGLADGAEIHIWLTDPLVQDMDDDDLSDGDEVLTHGTDPFDANTDDDGVDDGDEVLVWLTDPLDPDTDGDGIEDGGTVTGTFINTDGELDEFTYYEDNSHSELNSDGITNVLDADSDRSDNLLYEDFHDRTEVAYEGYVAAKNARTGQRWHVGPLNPGDVDTDGDSFNDWQEVFTEHDPLDGTDHGLNEYTVENSDADNLADVEEDILEGGIDPPVMRTLPDTDGDGINDDAELHPTWWAGASDNRNATDPNVADMDGDGWSDGTEVLVEGTNPHVRDTDGDGFEDDWEDTKGYDPLLFDTDDDELWDSYEDADGDGQAWPDGNETNVIVADTDGDLIMDGPELTFGIDPLLPDSDGDLIDDGVEVGAASDAHNLTKTDPRLLDSDFDGWEDGVEDGNQNGLYEPLLDETDAQDRDSDDDGLPDYYEAAGNNPAVYPATTYAVDWIDNSSDPTDPWAIDTEAPIDGLEDGLEFEQLCDPNVGDTDGDGILDGDEFIGYRTDPSNVDTDGDGCQEQFGGSDIENVDVDTDGDGIHNAMDVDSDNDWVWDGAGNEDCAGANDVDLDGYPDILDGDSDNDNLADWQEKGLDTWHDGTPAEPWQYNDRDWDDDGIMDGDEYFHSLHQPHTSEQPGFRGSDPKDPDTDQDQLHDGLEAGVDAAMLVDPVFGGTDVPYPGPWDPDGDGVSYADPGNVLDGTVESDVRFWDSDMDALTDFEEDADYDGEFADYGATETWPEDDDSDDEGVLDGYEVLTLGIDPLLCDTDGDLLPDGLEIGLLAAMGDDTSWTSSACWAVGLDYRDDVDYGAYATDPDDFDTDGDFLLDGEEDANRDGFRDGNDPFDGPDPALSDWDPGVLPGETDPNEWDTDRGGEDDGTEVGAGTDPLLWSDGDWDLDLLVGCPGRAAGDTLDVGVAGTGIKPGMSGMSQVYVYHTGALNPDPLDGPSVAAQIDSIYLRATSLHWAGPLWGVDYEVPEEDMEDWFHYTAVSFSDQDFSLMQDDGLCVDVTVDVPEGAMPGWYMGYVQVETRRAFMEQELPDDYVVLRVYVAPHKDLDICDDDGDPRGVGLASAPYQFPPAHPPAETEMHLVGVPEYPGTIEGMFRYANPNTHPDGVWPFSIPPPDPDGVNDFNGLPAYPWVNRTWDTNTLDVQGNVNMTYEIEAEYEFNWSDSGMDPTSVISFASPIRDYLNLSEVDSAYVTIDTTTLPEGMYEGIVRVFEDAHGPGGPGTDPDGECQTATEVYDEFTLKFWLTVADIDVDDDYASMSGNHMTIEVLPGAPQGEVQVIQELRLVNPDSGNNIDDWDGPSGEATEDFWLYRYWNYGGAVADMYDRIPTYDSPTEPDPLNPDAVSFEVFLGGDPDNESILVWLDGVFGDTLEIGEAKKLRLWVGSTPEFLPAGEYTTPARDGWPYGSGTVALCTRGRATGLGFDHPDVDEVDPWIMGPGIVYDEDILAVEDLMDYFDLTVVVPVIPDVAFDAVSWDVTGDPGDHLCQATIVNNLGNADIADVHFDVTQLECVTDPNEVILPTQIDFEPASIDITLGGFESVDICVDIPNGAYACTYEGFVSLLAAGEEEFDQLPMNVTVNCVPGMDVEETAYGVAGNLMTLTPGPGGSGAKQFQLTNLGNCEIYNVAAVVDSFEDGIDITFTVDDMVPWQGFVLGTVEAEWVSPWPDFGIYHGTVTVTADGDLVDTFDLDVHILPAMEIAEDDLNVADNMMTLTPDAPEPERVTGQFKLVNTGPTDLSGITALAIEGLPDGVTSSVTIGSTCDWAGFIVGDVMVDWTDATVAYGAYATNVYVTADGGITDNFGLTVMITELPAAEFYDDDFSVIGVPGEPVQGEFTVVNIGNVTLEEGRVTFGVSDLVGATGSMIPGSNVEIFPESAEIAHMGEHTFTAVIDVPDGLLGQDYVGHIDLFVDGEGMEDALEVTVTVERGAGYVNIFPNPYREADHAGMGITFALGEGAEDATITIYDMFGNLVTTLGGESESRNGTDELWEDPLENDDGKQVASGMYIVTIDDGDDVETRKIMVIR